MPNSNCNKIYIFPSITQDYNLEQLLWANITVNLLTFTLNSYKDLTGTDLIILNIDWFFASVTAAVIRRISAPWCVAVATIVKKPSKCELIECMLRVSSLSGWYWLTLNRSSFFITAHSLRFINWIKVGYVRWGGDLWTVWCLYATHTIAPVHISKERVLFDFFNSICPKPSIWTCAELQDQVSGLPAKGWLPGDMQCFFPVDDLHTEKIIAITDWCKQNSPKNG